MLAFVCAIRMPAAWSAREAGNGTVFRPAVFAGVLGFFLTFVQGVFPLVRPIRVPVAWSACERGNAAVFCATIFAIVV